jgi:hypothetical protein
MERLVLKCAHRTRRTGYSSGVLLQQPLHSIQLTPIEQPGMRPVLLLVAASFVSVVSARGGGGAPECVAHSVAAQLPLLRLPPLDHAHPLVASSARPRP